MRIGKSATIYIAILFALVGLSVAVAYYRYMMRQDFTYFQTADQIPNRFDVSVYSKL